MSSKKTRKMRQEVKRQLNNKAEIIIDAMCAHPFKARLKIARRIVMGLGTDKMRVRAIRKRNKVAAR